MVEILENRNLLLEKIPKNITIAELGVFKGEFSEIIKNIASPSLLYLVDIFEGTCCSGDKDGKNIINYNMNRSYEDIKNKYKEQNVVIIKNTTENFLLSLNDESLDAVYIDADHSYEGVKKDLELSRKKVKKGGFIMGHDYTNVFFPGVVKAVDEFCQKYNLKIKYLTKDGCPSFLIQNM